MSKAVFNDNPDTNVFRIYLEARKTWCASVVDWDNSNALKRYIDGRFNPGVRPNQAILDIYKKHLNMFPW